MAWVRCCGGSKANTFTITNFKLNHNSPVGANYDTDSADAYFDVTNFNTVTLSNVSITRGSLQVFLDGTSVAYNNPINVSNGSTLRILASTDHGTGAGGTYFVSIGSIVFS